MPTNNDPIIDSWLDLAEENRGSDRYRVSYAAFQAILEGRAATRDEIATVSGLPTHELHRLIPEMVREGRLTLNDSAERVTGAGGLSLVESRHRLKMNSRTFWVWCALDAVGIPAGLKVDAAVYSYCTDTRDPVKIDVNDGMAKSIQPESIAISLVPPLLDRSLQECCCSEIGFFADAGNVPPELAAVTVAEAMDLGRRLWRDGIPL